mmetsp:Transcript_881/g.1957  ORF Transcript_881/g.1957 Transcript_881/m.1957 type:complete len:223 (-) Transcript_881:2673-3341(-)
MSESNEDEDAGIVERFSQLLQTPMRQKLLVRLVRTENAEDTHSTPISRSSDTEDEVREEGNVGNSSSSSSTNSNSTSSYMARPARRSHRAAAIDGQLDLHDQVVFTTVHCPPFASIVSVWIEGAQCNCTDYFARCGRLDNFSELYARGVDLAEEMQEAISNVDDGIVLANNKRRFRLYGRAFHALDQGIVEQGVRVRLPICVEAYIRQMYPAADGKYKGYRE